jgi:hypothetical protein
MSFLWRKPAPAPSSTPIAEVTESAKQAAARKQKEEFRKYVVEISAFQKNQVADRIERLVQHQQRMYPYFFGCVSSSVIAVMSVFKIWGPRHLFKHQQYYVRPIPPAMAMGFVLYGLLYVSRGLLMRNRIWSLVEDYEFELKRVQAHHVQEGVDQLAWLQFMMDTLKQCGEARLDLKRLRD